MNVVKKVNYKFAVLEKVCDKKIKFTFLNGFWEYGIDWLLNVIKALNDGSELGLKVAESMGKI